MNVLKEAAETGVGTAKAPGPQGTGFLVRILPYIEGDTLSRNWNRNAAISCTNAGIAPYSPYSNFNLAITDVKGFYCPTRRNGLRAGVDNRMMLSSLWTGGGTDYGGCAGRHATFTLKTGYNLCDAAMHYDPDFLPAAGRKERRYAGQTLGHLSAQST